MVIGNKYLKLIVVLNKAQCALTCLFSPEDDLSLGQLLRHDVRNYKKHYRSPSVCMKINFTSKIPANFEKEVNS